MSRFASPPSSQFTQNGPTSPHSNCMRAYRTQPVSWQRLRDYSGILLRASTCARLVVEAVLANRKSLQVVTATAAVPTFDRRYLGCLCSGQAPLLTPEGMFAFDIFNQMFGYSRGPQAGVFRSYKRPRLRSPFPDLGCTKRSKSRPGRLQRSRVTWKATRKR